MSSEALFPHDIDCFVAIVPQQDVSRNFLAKVNKNADTIAINLALLLFLVWRFYLQKENRHHVFTIIFDTVGVFFNQRQIANDNRLKVVWDIILRGFSVLATTTLSAFVFKNLIEADSMEINTVDELVTSNLRIYAADYLKYQDIWQYMM